MGNKLWQWALIKMLEFLTANLTMEKVKEWADWVKAEIVPWVRNLKSELIANLRKKAAVTTSPIDDAMVDALDVFLEAFIPDVPTVL